MDENNRNGGEKAGLSAKSIFLPAAVVVLLLLAVLVGNEVRMDRAEQALALTAQAAASGQTGDGGAAGELSAALRQYRALQWVVTAALAALLAALTALLFALVLDPLGRCAGQVRAGEDLPADRGLAEFRRLGAAHNELLRRRKKAETRLQRQNQTDALTGLPNRFAFENYIEQLTEERPHTAVTVFSLDVNGLKETNDHEGHASGDVLLRSCAECIRDTFATGDENRKCFRFGGDEFAAFWVDVPLSELDGMLERFAQEQEKRGVSISVGYAHTEDLSATTVTALYEEADRNMYDKKAEFHRKQAQEVLDWLKLMT